MVSVVRLDVDFVRAVGLGALSLRAMGLRAQPLVLGAFRQHRTGVRLALATASRGFLRLGRQLQSWLLGRIPRRTIRIPGMVSAVASRQALRSDAQRATARIARKLSRAGRRQRNG